MRKILRSLPILFALFFSLPHAAMAESTPDYLDKIGGKLENGIANAVGGFLELPKTIMVMSRNEGPIYGMTAGLMLGMAHTMARTIYGAVDIATFMIPTRPLIEPNYIWNASDKMTTYESEVQMR